MTKTDMLPEERPFSAFGLSKALLGQLEKLGFTQATPIQWRAIPLALEKKDVIGIAQTGTGKTLAFSLPAIQHLADGAGIGLVLLPTRELALQVEEEMAKIGRYFGMKTAVLIGGASMYTQEKMLRRDPSVIIATPGRLIDHLQRGTVKLHDVQVLILDEADRMLDMGFEPQIRTILNEVPKERHTMLFSATMPATIREMVKKYMNNPLQIEVAPQGTTASRIEQEGLIVQKNDKLKTLYSLLQDVTGPTIVFSRTKHGAKKITEDLRDIGVGAAEIHSNRSLNQRKEALAGFKSGKYKVLIATDIAARGIDVNDIELVVNFDLHDASEDYVHRIGRTGRAGKGGRAVSFVEPRQRRDWKHIERLVRKTVPLRNPGNLVELPERGSVTPFREERGGGSRFGGGGGGGRGRFGRSSGGDRRSGGFSGGRGGFGRKRDDRSERPRPAARKDDFGFFEDGGQERKPAFNRGGRSAFGDRSERRPAFGQRRSAGSRFEGEERSAGDERPKRRFGAPRAGAHKPRARRSKGGGGGGFFGGRTAGRGEAGGAGGRKKRFARER